ncbi:BON domain-containing protein [Sphaerisporangium perillae]|uniref:BON domain-containing protein n=1 Tax=Sphaerisporangium perillae TaxID=2935860 RepID=UPI002010BBE3|nr:BON domain-containing protein [Sphaerisporangium perillae]
MSHEASHDVAPHHDAPHYDAPHYVAARVQRALAADERTYELGIRVDIRGDQLFLRGEVECEERRHLVAAVAGETAPGLKVHNEVTVVEVRGPGEEETL